MKSGIFSYAVRRHLHQSDIYNLVGPWPRRTPPFAAHCGNRFGTEAERHGKAVDQGSNNGTPNRLQGKRIRRLDGPSRPKVRFAAAEGPFRPLGPLGRRSASLVWRGWTKSRISAQFRPMVAVYGVIDRAARRGGQSLRGKTSLRGKDLGGQFGVAGVDCSGSAAK